MRKTDRMKNAGKRDEDFFSGRKGFAGANASKKKRGGNGSSALYSLEVSNSLIEEDQLMAVD